MFMHIAIVGGGPAGAWAALKLARAGARVTVFDASHPREKPCGGGLTGRAVQLIVSELGTLPAPAVSIRAARFERETAAPAPPASVVDGDAATVRLDRHGVSPRSALVVVSRALFDRGLLDAAVNAGAMLVGERVVDVNIETGGARIRTRTDTYHADIVLGADGANSLVRRRVRAAFARHQLSLGAGYFVHGASSEDIAIRWVADPPGYLWSFPRPDHLAVGMCAESRDAPGIEALRRHSANWIAAAGLAPASVRFEPYAWPIPTLDVEDFDGLPLASDRWMLLGDAAGLVDPLTREGIYYALLSAEMAAAAIGSGERNPAAAYRTHVADAVVPELRRAAALKRGFFGSAFSRLIVQALEESEAIREVMSDLISGRQPYIGLRRRLLSTGHLGLALKVITRGWGLAHGY